MAGTPSRHARYDPRAADASEYRSRAAALQLTGSDKPRAEAVGDAPDPFASTNARICHETPPTPLHLVRSSTDPRPNQPPRRQSPTRAPTLPLPNHRPLRHLPELRADRDRAV